MMAALVRAHVHAPARANALGCCLGMSLCPVCNLLTDLTPEPGFTRARIFLRGDGCRKIHYGLRIGGGAGGGNSLQLELGLGEAEKVEELEIRWPSGQVDIWEDLEVNQYLTVREGEAP